jgi:hypothetical protein
MVLEARPLDPDERIRTDRLNDAYPYWWWQDGRVWVAPTADAAAPGFLRHRTIDPVSCLGALSFEYLPGDRTLVQGVRRVPWLGAIDGRGRLTYQPAPPHGNRRASEAAIAAELFEALQEEVETYCQGRSLAYLLLSGGMDSRVMAAVVKRLQQTGRITAEVRAVTWGQAASRDVRYAEQLAGELGWPWTHLPLGPDEYWANFDRCVELLGAEVDPKHLHRMDGFESAPADAVVLAASYGDSVGRAEFSHLHVTQIPRLEPRDRFALLRDTVRRDASRELQIELNLPRARYGERSEMGWREIERQLHYMRRMLGNTLCVIERWCRVEQLFVTRPVFGLMWNLDPACRTDGIYVELLKQAAPHLLDVPWARTGAAYGAEPEAGDDLPKGFHRYGLWLRRDHADRLEHMLFGDDVLRRLEIFDFEQIQWLFREWRKERLEDDTTPCTQLSWLAVTAEFARRHDLEPPDRRPPQQRTLSERAGRRLARGLQIVSRTSRPLRMAVKDRK